MALNLYELGADEKIFSASCVTQSRMSQRIGTSIKTFQSVPGRGDDETGGYGRLGEPECTESAKNEKGSVVSS
jgi:hypothetical protein